jgi:hypothetical protein
MFVVRYLALAALAVWVGGLVVLGAVVAPSTFRVLQAVDPAGGRALAGLAFGEILQRFHLLAYACGALVFVSLWVMKFVGPPPSWFVFRSAVVASMLAVALYAGIPVANEIEGLRKELAGPAHGVPEHDARRGRFEALHRRSTALMAVETGLGFFLLLWYVREGSL